MKYEDAIKFDGTDSIYAINDKQIRIDIEKIDDIEGVYYVIKLFGFKTNEKRVTQNLTAFEDVLCFKSLNWRI